MADGKIVITGGNDGIYTLSSVETYTPGDNRTEMMEGEMREKRQKHGCTSYKTAAGETAVVVAGGWCKYNLA